MWASLKLTARQLGVADALLYYLSQAMRRLSGQRARIVRYHIVAQPVRAVAVARPAAGSAAVRQLLAGDPALAALPRAPAVLEARFANGDVCLAIFAKGTLAGFLWLAFGGYEEDEVRCRYQLPDPHLGWDYDVHIEPAYRMSRSLARLWDAANERLAARGVRWSLSRISAFNPASLAAHARLGARPMQSITFVCLGPLELAVASGGRVLTMSITPATRPVLRLQAPSDSAE